MKEQEEEAERKENTLWTLNKQKVRKRIANEERNPRKPGMRTKIK